MTEATNATAETRRHYHLICGQLIFTHGEDQAITSVPNNAMLVTDQKQLPLSALGQAQQALQKTFHSKMQMDMENVKMLDVIVMSIIHMGEFTSKEFYDNLPEKDQKQ